MLGTTLLRVTESEGNVDRLRGGRSRRFRGSDGAVHRRLWILLARSSSHGSRSAYARCRHRVDLVGAGHQRVSGRLRLEVGRDVLAVGDCGLLDDAAEAMQEFTTPHSTAVRMAAQLADPRFAYCGFYDADSEVPGLGDWIEQLIAESTGKNGRGVLPIVTKKSESDMYPVIGFTNKHELAVVGPLGAQFIFWEWVTALLGYLLNVDPFNQPNVTESKERTGALLSDWEASPLAHERAIFETSSIAIYSSARCSDLSEYLKSSVESSRGYLAIMAYLNREKDSEIVEFREVLEKKAKRPTTFGWGPRFLHSTGQFHKGGPLTGSFIQITADSTEDVEIPGAGYGFQRLILAQALGDNQALVARELPVLRLHLKDREMGIKEILAVARAL